MDSKRHFVDAIVSFYTKTFKHNKSNKWSRAQKMWQLLSTPNSKLNYISYFAYNTLKSVIGWLKFLELKKMVSKTNIDMSIGLFKK